MLPPILANIRDAVNKSEQVLQHEEKGANYARKVGGHLRFFCCCCSCAYLHCSHLTIGSVGDPHYFVQPWYCQNNDECGGTPAAATGKEGHHWDSWKA